MSTSNGSRRIDVVGKMKNKYFKRKIAPQRLRQEFIYAAMTCNMKSLSQLLDRGADPNVYSDYSVTALHMAAERGDVVLGYRLITCKGIELNPRTDHSLTPLILACLFNKKKFALMLLRHGADPDLPDRFGQSPLHYCVRSGSHGIIFHLIRFRANVNAKDCFENTPLSFSLLDKPNISVAKLLLRHGASLQDDEASPKQHLFFELLLKCRTSDDIDGVLLLLDHGVDVNMTDRATGRNCLHFAAIAGFLELTVVLARRGANVHLVDRSSRTPLAIAREHNNGLVAMYLQGKTRKLKFNPLVQVRSISSAEMEDEEEERREF